jgi:hypothetical protein
MRCLIAIVALSILAADARAGDPDADVKAAINRGLSFLAKDSLAWRTSKKCSECHHAPFTIWALNEGKKQGYAVDEDVLAETTSWVLGEDFLARLLKEAPDQKEIVFNESATLPGSGHRGGRHERQARQSEETVHLRCERSADRRLVEAGE